MIRYHKEQGFRHFSAQGILKHLLRHEKARIARGAASRLWFLD
jgi:hypothetical protein